MQGQWWVLASDGHARESPVFDLEMRRRGTLDAPYGSNIPHPQIFTLPDGTWAMTTFDGTQYAKPLMGYGTHGHVVVMRPVPQPSPLARRLRSGRLARRLRSGPLAGLVRRLRPLRRLAHRSA